MKIEFKKNGQVITNLQEWEKVGNPKSSNQWKLGRSAMEMAKFALSNSFEIAIKKVLKECNIKEQDFVCEPEAKTSLGKGFNRGGCRNHDLLMIGEDCIIGIEAKVSEPFDDDINKVKEKQALKYKTESDTRAGKLISDLWRKDGTSNIGYQLFTSTRGTLVAANREQKKCILLVIVFSGNVTEESNYEKNCKRNNNHFNDFLSGIKADGEGHISRDVDGHEIDCWIKKLEVKISDQYSF